MLNDFTRLAPRWSAQCEKGVQRIFRKHMSILKLGVAEMTESFENGKIGNQITDRDSDSRFTQFGSKDAEWKTLDGKMRIGWDFDERLEGHFDCSSDSMSVA